MESEDTAERKHAEVMSETESPAEQCSVLTGQQCMSRNERIAVGLFGAGVAFLGLRQVTGDLIWFTTDSGAPSFLSTMSLEDAVELVKYNVLAVVIAALGIRLARLPRENLRGVIAVFGAFQIIFWASVCANNVSGLLEFWTAMRKLDLLDRGSSAFLRNLSLMGIALLGGYCGFLFMNAKKKALYTLRVLNGFVAAFTLVAFVSFRLYFSTPLGPGSLVDEVPFILAAVCFFVVMVSPFWFSHRHKEAFS